MKQRHDTHHRKPRSIGGRSHHKNVIRVPRNQHVAYHLLFRNYTPDIIAEILNKYWIDPHYQLIVVQRDFSKIEVIEETF